MKSIWHNALILLKMNSKPKPSFEVQIERLADVTKCSIVRGNIDKAKKCILKAEEIYNKGSKEIKNAIDIYFIYPVSSFLEISHFKVSNFFPPSLNNEYKKQINALSL